MSDDPKLPGWNPTFSPSQGHMAHDRFGHDPGKIPMGDHPNRRKILLVLIAVVAILAVTVGVVWATSGGSPQSVSDVADDAVSAAEDLDVDAGIDLLCEPPTADEREQLEDLIAAGREQAGTEHPDVSYGVANVEGDEEGTFRVTISSDEQGLDESHALVEVDVERDGDRSCISGYDVDVEDGPLPLDR